MAWHKDTTLPQGLDFIVVPGGFSYGDYLRCGAIAARSPIINAVKAAAERGVAVLGVCNGFQVLCEVGLLPGALVRNAGLDFVCRPQPLRIAAPHARFLQAYGGRSEVTFPIAHHDGCYIADEPVLDRLAGEGRIAFTYLGNPNGSARDIAGVTNERGNVLGLMPHPERAVDPLHGGVDGLGLFESVMETAA